AGPATDIFQLGALAYQMLCGQKPWGEAADPGAMRTQILSSAPAPLRSLAPGLPEDVYRAIESVLSPDPTRRFARATHFAGVLGSASASTAGAPMFGTGTQRVPVSPPAAPPPPVPPPAAGAWPPAAAPNPLSSPTVAGQPWPNQTTGTQSIPGGVPQAGMPPIWGASAPPPPAPPPAATIPPVSTVLRPQAQKRSRRGLLIGLGAGLAVLVAGGGGAAAYLLLFKDDGAPVATFAGAAGQAGFAEGKAGTARFNQPNAVAVDSKGTLYVADIVNQRIRRISGDGTASTLAGTGDTGADNGPAGTARFAQPYGVAVDKDGNVYVADYGNFLLRKISPKGEVSTLAGSGQHGFANGEAFDAKFGRLTSVAVDKDGNVYVADTENHSIRKVTPSGSVSTLAGAGQRGDAD